ncbi:hypothetical protein OI18_03920 [Flavihumibacter solisilvae]|uniref:Uncharacterized protein n=1 Tax=Flavihumibacter solisilvae TaxID=1349421 RepID=A0A0C1LK94_9BACT|nr:hypothetical protein OI18_03920 [Flavihumibacter solisilvae]
MKQQNTISLKSHTESEIQKPASIHEPASIRKTKYPCINEKPMKYPVSEKSPELSRTVHDPLS